MIKSIKRSELVFLASRAFLSEPLPVNHKELDDIDLDDYLENHKWEPLEHYTTNEILRYIEDMADIFGIFLVNKGILVEIDG